MILSVRPNFRGLISLNVIISYTVFLYCNTCIHFHSLNNIMVFKNYIFCKEIKNLKFLFCNKDEHSYQITVFKCIPLPLLTHFINLISVKMLLLTEKLHCTFISVCLTRFSILYMYGWQGLIMYGLTDLTCSYWIMYCTDLTFINYASTLGFI